MSREIFRTPAGTVIATSYCGPERTDNGCRQRIQLDAAMPWPYNTLNAEEVVALWAALGAWIHESGAKR